MLLSSGILAGCQTTTSSLPACPRSEIYWSGQIPSEAYRRAVLQTFPVVQDEYGQAVCVRQDAAGNSLAAQCFVYERWRELEDYCYGSAEASR